MLDPFFHTLVLLLSSLIVTGNLLQERSLHEELVLVLGVTLLQEVSAGILVEQGYRIIHLDIAVVQNMGQLFLLL